MLVVTAAFMERQGRIFIARRAPGSSHAGKWEFPGGKLEDGESPESAMARELAEELGIRAVVGEKLAETEWHDPEDRDRSVRLLFFRILSFEGEPHLHEHDAGAWALRSELGSYVFAPADRPFVEELLAGRH